MGLCNFGIPSPRTPLLLWTLSKRCKHGSWTHAHCVTINISPLQTVFNNVEGVLRRSAETLTTNQIIVLLLGIYCLVDPNSIPKCRQTLSLCWLNCKTVASVLLFWGLLGAVSVRATLGLVIGTPKSEWQHASCNANCAPLLWTHSNLSWPLPRSENEIGKKLFGGVKIFFSWVCYLCFAGGNIELWEVFHPVWNACLNVKLLVFIQLRSMQINVYKVVMV